MDSCRRGDSPTLDQSTQKKNKFDLFGCAVVLVVVVMTQTFVVLEHRLQIREIGVFYGASGSELF